jgi:hypothetical protein
MSRNSLTVPSLGTVYSLWKGVAFQTLGTLGTLKLEGLWTPRVLEYRGFVQLWTAIGCLWDAFKTNPFKYPKTFPL